MNLSLLVPAAIPEFTASEAVRWLISLLLDNALRYLVFAGLAWVLAYDWFYTKWLRRKVISQRPESVQVRREVMRSGIAILVYSVVSFVTIALVYRGHGRIYLDLNEHSKTWSVTSILLAVVLHDTWFYWTHRLMHHRLLFMAVHAVHHQSTNPTPWASYSFSVPEAFLQALIFPIVIFVIPIHPLAIAAFLLIQILWNVLGHTGFEYYPPWFLRTPIGKIMTTPTAHTLHHEFRSGNYGLYFIIWDRLMGTLRDDYQVRFKAVTDPRRG